MSESELMIFIYIHIERYIYSCVWVYLFVCVCVSVCVSAYSSGKGQDWGVALGPPTADPTPSLKYPAPPSLPTPYPALCFPPHSW